MRLLLVVVALCLVGQVYGKCFADRNPVPVGVTTMDMCCWWHDSTCCANVNGVSANLTNFQTALDDLFQEGLSQQCYYQVANLICAFCSPDQADFITFTGLLDKNDNSLFGNRGYTMRICSDYCSDLARACNNPSDAAILGATYSPLNSALFCESIKSKTLVDDKDKVSGIWEAVIFRVSDFNCFEAVSVQSVKSEVGVCLVPYEDLQIEVKSDSAASTLAPVSLFITMVVMFSSFVVGMFVRTC